MKYAYNTALFAHVYIHTDGGGGKEKASPCFHETLYLIQPNLPFSRRGTIYIYVVVYKAQSAKTRL